MKLIAPFALSFLCACAAPKPTTHANPATPNVSPNSSALASLTHAPENGDGVEARSEGRGLESLTLRTMTASSPVGSSYNEPQGGSEPQMGIAIPYEPGVFNLTLGSRFLENSAWGDLDNQLALGLDYTIKKPGSWLGLNVGALGSYDREKVGGTDIDSWMAEATIGPRAYVMFGQSVPFYCYAGVGLSLVYGELERATRRANKTTIGGSASAGLMYQLNSRQALGVEWRTLQFADFDSGTDGAPDDMNYNQISLVFSAGF